MSQPAESPGEMLHKVRLLRERWAMAEQLHLALGNTYASIVALSGDRDDGASKQLEVHRSHAAACGEIVATYDEAIQEIVGMN